MTLKRISDLISQSGRTASSIFKELKIPHNALTEWKKGKAKPSTEALTKIADHFGVSVDYLLGRTDNPAPSELPINFEMPPELEDVHLAFYGGPTNLTKKSLQDIADFVKFVQERDKNEKK